MKAVIQRVDGAELSVNGESKAAIARGLVVYVGVEQADDCSVAETFAKKLVAMRIFQDEKGKMNLSVADIKGDILLVPNFTLCADISHGHRPSFIGAMEPRAAQMTFEYLVFSVKKLMCESDCSDNVKSGIFGADMKIDQVNDGPVTIIY